MKDKILLIELAGIGDAVLSTPAIRNLRRCFPDAYICYLTLPGPAQLMSKSPYLDCVYSLQHEMRINDNFSVLNKLRRFNFDTAINLYQLYTKIGALKMAFLLNFLKAKRNIGRDTDGRGHFYSIKVPDSLVSERHDVEFKLDLLKILGCRIEDKNLELWFDDLDARIAGEFLEENSISDSDILIGVHPGAHRLSRRWDYRRFAAVADQLIKMYKAKIIITGSKQDQGLVRNIRLRMSNPSIDASGRFSLTQITALIKMCDLFITNDTAPMHIANTLAVPLIAVMGSGSLRTSPYQKENCIVLRKNVDCSPCYKFACKDRKCLEAIIVEMVIDASKQLLKLQ